MKLKRRKRSISLSDDDDDGMMMDDESHKESSRWPELHSKFPRCSQPPRRDVEEFAQSNGIKVKFGLFTEEEDKIISNNFKQFCQDLKIEDNEKVRLTLLGFAKKDDDDFIKELGKEEMAKVYDFKFRLAQGLDERLIGSVYQRARKILAPFKRADHLSKDERNKIVESFHGTPRKFVESALEKKIDPKTLRRLVVRKMDPENKTYKVGVWNRKEGKKLIKCLRKRFPTIDNVYEIKCRNISWATISKKVKTRSPDQCRNHFIYLKQKQRPVSFSDESFEESNDSEEDEESKISKDDQDHIIQTKELTSMDQDQNLDQGLNKNDKQDQHNGVNEDNEENDDSEDNEESDDSDENDEDQKEQSDENESGKQEDPEVDIREPDTTPVQRDTTDPPENGTGQSTEAEVSNTLIESNGQLERIEETENLNHKEQEENIEEDKHDHENNIDENGDTGNDSMEGVFTQINETASFETNSPSPMKSKKRKKKKKKKIEDGTTLSNQDHESHVEPTTATALAIATEGDSNPLSPRSTGEIDPKMISDGSLTSPRKSRKRKKKSKQGKDNSTSNETSTPLKNSEEPKEFDQINASQGSEWGVKSIKSPEINKRSKKANRKRKKSSLNLTL